jgi:3-oxoacyl-[acyl-carrier protein] reductase
LTRACAIALAPRGIRVNCISPGIAEFSKKDSRRKRASLIAQVPLQRPGTSEEIGQAVVFLAEHDYINGQELVLDGGWTLT